MRMTLKAWSCEVLAVMLALAPCVAMLAAFRHRGAEMMVLSAIGFSPIWLMTTLAAWMLHEESVRLRKGMGWGKGS